jgi:endonuclease YncB( thermonuclease family)
MYRLAVFFAFSALAFAPLAARAADVIAGPVEAEVLRVVDGDTLKVQAKIWLGQTVEVDVRLAGIDAPELHGACDREREAALAAKDELAALTSGGKVRLTDIRRDKFGGRVIAHVGGEGAEDLSAALVARHFARAYGGGKRGGWCALAARD